jgi:hypothetical protein
MERCEFCNAPIKEGRYGCESRKLDNGLMQRTQTCEIWELRNTLNRMSASCRELMQAMRDYEMDVDTDQPLKHREMMQRALAAIEDHDGLRMKTDRETSEWIEVFSADD